MSMMTELIDPNSKTGNHSTLSQNQPVSTLPRSSSSSITSQAEAPVQLARPSLESQVFTQQEVDEKPWKYVGYQGYTKFLASDTDFLVFQRFGVVSARILLRLQDRVVILQEKLDKLDRQLKGRESKDIHNGSFRLVDEEREIVLNELQVALSEYSKLLSYLNYLKLERKLMWHI